MVQIYAFLAEVTGPWAPTPSQVLIRKYAIIRVFREIDGIIAFLVQT